MRPQMIPDTHLLKLLFFAKIAIPYTIYPSLSLLEFDVLDC